MNNVELNNKHLCITVSVVIQDCVPSSLLCTGDNHY